MQLGFRRERGRRGFYRRDRLGEVGRVSGGIGIGSLGVKPCPPRSRAGG
jgi:hypothetical protein